ncbi:Centromere protein O [Acipenser ruthenus]|uniref:Centromere protein O n=1 Tax=Acipenser ruthenus TaxID=7906 RepID=A0A662YPC0_ACIRT|nr:Centromere protein O [Acipenser ruthenus]
MLEARSRSLALQQQEGLLQQERLAELRETVEVLQVSRDQLRAKIATGRVARQLEEESDTDDEDEESLSPDEETLMAIMNARVINLQNMLQVHRLAGFDIKVARPGRAVCFTVYTAFEGIYLDTYCLDVDIKQIQISRHNIPPHIPVAELAEQYLRQDIPTFLSMLSRHLNAYVGRKYQIDQIKEHFGGSVLIENTLCGMLSLEYSTCCKGVEHKFIVALEYRDVTRCMPTKVTVTFTDRYFQLHPATPEARPALANAVPCPLLLDTLPVCLDLPALDLEPRSLHHRPQLCPWFRTPLFPSTQMSLGCCQMLLVLPLFAASLPWVIGHHCAGPQVKTSARCCILLFPGHRFSRPCHPGRVPCHWFVVLPWKCRRDRPTLKPARGRGRRLKKSDLRVGGLLRVEGSALGMADQCCTL